MSRYYDYMVIEFTDGSTERVGGNRATVQNDVLNISTEDSLGFLANVRHFPLVNIKSYRWEGS